MGEVVHRASLKHSFPSSSQPKAIRTLMVSGDLFDLSRFFLHFYNFYA